MTYVRNWSLIMPRPCRQRRIRKFPDYWVFTADGSVNDELITMGVDEYEVIRLIDYEGMNQEECAASMGVARTTVTSIYTSARSKLSKLIIEGKKLRITGGAYHICSGADIEISRKREGAVRIAVPYENGQVFRHFGRSREFKLYDISAGRIIEERIVQSTEGGHGSLVGMLKELSVDKLICGGIGAGARTAVSEAGMELYHGRDGVADDVVMAFLAADLHTGRE